MLQVFKWYKYSTNKHRFNELNRINHKISKTTRSRHNLSKIRHSLTLDFLLESLGPKLKKNSNISVMSNNLKPEILDYIYNINIEQEELLNPVN